MVDTNSGGEETHKVDKHNDFTCVGQFFLVAVKNHKKSMYEFNLESGLLFYFFYGESFMVQIFKK